jgi:small subunit ribosomal protein S6
MADRRRYEVMLIMDPKLEDAAIQQAVERFVGIVTSRGGEATKVDHWGRRKLAFELNHRHEGYYVVADLQADAATVAELDRVLRLADELVRHKIVRPGRG